MRTRKNRRKEAKEQWKEAKKRMSFTEFWRKKFIKN